MMIQQTRLVDRRVTTVGSSRAHGRAPTRAWSRSDSRIHLSYTGLIGNSSHPVMYPPYPTEPRQTDCESSPASATRRAYTYLGGASMTNISWSPSISSVHHAQVAPTGDSEGGPGRFERRTCLSLQIGRYLDTKLQYHFRPRRHW